MSRAWSTCPVRVALTFLILEELQHSAHIHSPGESLLAHCWVSVPCRPLDASPGSELSLVLLVLQPWCRRCLERLCPHPACVELVSHWRSPR